MNPFNDISRNTLQAFSVMPDEANIRLPVILLLLGCSRATLYRHIKNGLFPQPLRFGSRMSVWKAGAIRVVLNDLRCATPVALVQPKKSLCN